MASLMEPTVFPQPHMPSCGALPEMFHLAPPTYCVVSGIPPLSRSFWPYVALCGTDSLKPATQVGERKQILVVMGRNCRSTDSAMYDMRVASEETSANIMHRFGRRLCLRIRVAGPLHRSDRENSRPYYHIYGGLVGTEASYSDG